MKLAKKIFLILSFLIVAVGCEELRSDFDVPPSVTVLESDGFFISTASYPLGDTVGIIFNLASGEIPLSSVQIFTDTGFIYDVLSQNYWNGALGGLGFIPSGNIYWKDTAFIVPPYFGTLDDSAFLDTLTLADITADSLSFPDSVIFDTTFTDSIYWDTIFYIDSTEISFKVNDENGKSSLGKLKIYIE